MVMHSKGKNGKKDMMKKEDTEKVKTGALTAAQKNYHQPSKLLF